VRSRVLLADDDERVADSFAAILRHAGYDVAVARDGVEAVERARETAFHAAILDLVMPRLDGIKALRYIRQLRPALSPIILAAEISDRDRVAALEYGAAVVLLKPPDVQELLDVVARLVGDPDASCVD
jgi:DNA-binding response OmpR family regulator